MPIEIPMIVESTIETPITAAEITVTTPVQGEMPSSTAAGTGYFTIGAVEWAPAHSPFQGATQYTATVTLTANSGYTFTGLADVTINGQSATVTDNTGTAVTLSYQFPSMHKSYMFADILGNQDCFLHYSFSGSCRYTPVHVKSIDF